MRDGEHVFLVSCGRSASTFSQFSDGQIALFVAKVTTNHCWVQRPSVLAVKAEKLRTVNYIGGGAYWEKFMPKRIYINVAESAISTSKAFNCCQWFTASQRAWDWEQLTVVTWLEQQFNI